MVFLKYFPNLIVLTISCILIERCEQVGAKKYVYEIREIEMPVDHFNYANNETFKLRYLFNDSFVDDDRSPLFFYTGNEGDVELFAQNSGFIWELASKFRACVVFAEHRYYGKSLPFGNATFNSTDNIGFLSVEQALEDFATVIDTLWTSKSSPVIAFGGSYGGMLAAWLRMKYPHLVYGSLAASAPVWQFNGLTACDIFFKITTSVFTTSYSSNCSANIKKSWSMFKNLSTTENGRQQLNAAFNFCDPIKDPENINKFLDYLEDVYGNLAMANYPYENNFLAVLPAYPVRQFCLYLKELHKDEDLLMAMQRALSVYTNYTGTSKCLDYKSSYPTLGENSWNIQTCNQMVMPMCSNLTETMFRDKEWNFKTYSDNCYKLFNIRPKLNDIVLRYGGKNLQAVSNIIFSNGLLDPWSGGGVLETAGNQVFIIIIPEGAHHLDLRESNPSDPISVKEARKQEADIIGKWIKDYFNFIF